jgi:hypothetical protein
MIRVFAVPISSSLLELCLKADGIMPRLVDVDTLHFHQASLSTAALSRWTEAERHWPPITTIVLGLKRYIVDGNHRAWICQIRGTAKILAYDYWPAAELPPGGA